MIDMKIDKYEKIGKGKYRIFLANGEVIDTYDNVILKNNLLIKKVLTPSIYDKITADTIVEDAYAQAFKYISLRIRSVKEIKDYLKKKNTTDEIIEKVIARLQDERIIDDDKFTHAFINDKVRFTSMGNYKIINELKRHQIKEEVIERNLYLMDSNVMQEKIRKIIEKQLRCNKKYSGIILKNKIYTNLIKLGYTSNDINAVMSDYF